MAFNTIVYRPAERVFRDGEHNIVFDIDGTVVTNPKNSLQVNNGVIINRFIAESPRIPVPPQSAILVGQLAVLHEASLAMRKEIEDKISAASVSGEAVHA